MVQVALYFYGVICIITIGVNRRSAMFSVRQKREISEKVQQILRETNHSELPEGEIQFLLGVQGATSMSRAEIRNNGAITNPSVNLWNEKQDGR